MIGLDTNILARYITQDDPQQSVIANRLIETHCSRHSPCHVDTIVLCEIVWVLCRAYGYEKEQLLAVLEQILATAELTIENDTLAFRALDAWRDGSADFSDYLLTLGNQAAGCETTLSFDRKLAQHAAVTLAT